MRTVRKFSQSIAYVLYCHKVYVLRIKASSVYL